MLLVGHPTYLGRLVSADVWRNKEDGSWGGAWETGDPFKKANDDFDGHGAFAASSFVLDVASTA